MEYKDGAIMYELLNYFFYNPKHNSNNNMEKKAKKNCEPTCYIKQRILTSMSFSSLYIDCIVQYVYSVHMQPINKVFLN